MGVARTKKIGASSYSRLIGFSGTQKSFFSALFPGVVKHF